MSRAPSDFFRPFGKLPVRRRVLIAVLAIGTAFGIVLTLVGKPGGAQRPPGPPPADVAVCKPGETQACVGSPSQVITTPPR